MRKKDYEILASAIKKHGSENISVPYHYATPDQALGARIACERIARTFAQFAHVDKDNFLLACGVSDVKLQSGAENANRRQT